MTVGGMLELALGVTWTTPATGGDARLVPGEKLTFALSVKYRFW